MHTTMCMITRASHSGWETTEPQVYFVSGYDGIGSGWHGRYGIVHGYDGTTKLQIWFNYQGGRHASRTHVIPLPASSNPDLSEVPYFRLAFHALFSMRVGMVLKGCVESDPAKPQITMVLIAKEVATPPPIDHLASAATSSASSSTTYRPGILSI